VSEKEPFGRRRGRGGEDVSEKAGVIGGGGIGRHRVVRVRTIVMSTFTSPGPEEDPPLCSKTVHSVG
jgi:hypothetical protein